MSEMRRGTDLGENQTAANFVADANNSNIKQALIIVDIQNDFCPGGSLAVTGGDGIVELTNSLAEQFSAVGDLVLATQDWHPADHGSFASQHKGVTVGEMGELSGLPQVFWPDHCIAETQGAEFHPNLKAELIDVVFRKGTDRRIDSYSGFYDNDHASSTGLAEFLRTEGVTDVVVVGLATDYCVLATALDALTEGFAVTVISDACRAVNISPDDGRQALKRLEEAGVQIVDSSRFGSDRIVS
ncbi:MAG: bifunctional nicotinamidase/pyrazinamidase [Coriobacteriales bacterium]|jgi:nicotinamidase/pyrazinamidase|nr:bifunctional nicotinamidase/pyrazinamidase [Coriobacteriales bacterium]